MNFSSAVALLFATASSVKAGEHGLRNLATVVGFSEELGECTGAKCGIWGDPHIDSCDGKSYDCQAVGLFTLMKNMAFNIQGNFVEVGSKEVAFVQQKGWDLPLGTTITNDVMIDFKLDDNTPTMQFGFGDVSIPEGQDKYTYPDEGGCEIDYYYKRGGISGVKTSKEANVAQCRERCAATDGCDKFTYWGDGRCQLIAAKGKLTKVTNTKWSRTASGSLTSDCGKHHEDMSLIDQEQRMKHGYVGKRCPLLMWEDGEMKDVSDIIGSGMLYGKKGDRTSVELKEDKNGQDLIEITHTMPNKDKAVIHLKTRGKGPGELWSCHWDMYVCLPAAYSKEFEDTTTGLFGTPDGNPENEWMSPEGVELLMPPDNSHQAEMDYCLGNWCVSQVESIMAYHGDTTYKDHKCHSEPHRPHLDTCVMSLPKIKEVCDQVPLEKRQACETDCCMGGQDACAEIPDIMTDLERNNDPKPPQEESADECEDLEDTADTVCPSTEGGVVKLLKTTGTAAIPEGGDVFHSIIMDPDPDDNSMTTVRFKVNNPFDSAAHVYVKHDVNVLTDFTNSVCDGFILDPAGCESAQEIEVACKEFPGVEPFALVNVYFASAGLDSSNDAEIDKCCDAADYDAPVGIVEYTFQIECICPDDLLTQ